MTKKSMVVEKNIRPISTRRLNTLLRLHPGPINLVVFKGSHRDLILVVASHLDAFSGYPFHTWLPCAATGVTTGTPEVCPSRSFRIGDSAPQISYAHGR